MSLKGLKIRRLTIKYNLKGTEIIECKLHKKQQIAFYFRIFPQIKAYLILLKDKIILESNAGVMHWVPYSLELPLIITHPSISIRNDQIRIEKWYTKSVKITITDPSKSGSNKEEYFIRSNTDIQSLLSEYGFIVDSDKFDEMK